MQSIYNEILQIFTNTTRWTYVYTISSRYRHFSHIGKCTRWPSSFSECHQTYRCMNCESMNEKIERDRGNEDIWTTTTTKMNRKFQFTSKIKLQGFIHSVHSKARTQRFDEQNWIVNNLSFEMISKWIQNDHEIDTRRILDEYGMNMKLIRNEHEINTEWT